MGFVERALCVYLQARREFPLEPVFHMEAARVHLARGRRADAAIVLAEGGRAVGRARRADGIEMLRGALGLQPGHVQATLALALLLREEGQRKEARQLLERIEPSLRGATLRSARWEMFRVAPGIRAGWRWMTTLVAGEGHRPPNPAARATGRSRSARARVPEGPRRR